MEEDKEAEKFKTECANRRLANQLKTPDPKPKRGQRRGGTCCHCHEMVKDLTAHLFSDWCRACLREHTPRTEAQLKAYYREYAPAYYEQERHNALRMMAFYHTYMQNLAKAERLLKDDGVEAIQKSRPATESKKRRR